MTSRTEYSTQTPKKSTHSLANISVTIELWIQVFWVISVQFDLRNTLPKLGPFLLGHPAYESIYELTLVTGYKAFGCVTFQSAMHGTLPSFIKTVQKENNMIGLILDSVTWQRKMRITIPLKCSLLASGELVNENVAQNFVCSFGEKVTRDSC